MAKIKALNKTAGRVADAVMGRNKVRYEIDTAWLKGQLVDKFGDRGWGKETAKLMGIGPDTLSRLVNDGREWKPHTILRYQNIVRRSLDEIMSHLAPGIPIITSDASVKVTGHVGSDGIVHAGPSIGRRIVANPPGLIDAHAVTVIAPGTAMDGWVLYYSAPAARIEDMVGRLCVSRRQFHDDVVMGVLRKGSGVGLFGVAGFAGIAPAYEESRLIDAAPVDWVQMG